MSTKVLAFRRKEYEMKYSRQKTCFCGALFILKTVCGTLNEGI